MHHLFRDEIVKRLPAYEDWTPRQIGQQASRAEPRDLLGAAPQERCDFVLG